MGLAARLSRPVSVHCVKAYGKIVDYLRDAGGGETKTVGRGSSRTRGCSGDPDGGKGFSGVSDSDGIAGLREYHVGAGGDHDGGEVGGGGGGGVRLESKAERSAGGERNVRRGACNTGHERKQLLLPPRIALQ